MMTTTRFSSILRQAAAIAAVVIGALPSIHVSAGVHTALVAAGGALLTVEHLVTSLVQKVKTTNPTAGTTSTTTEATK